MKNSEHFQQDSSTAHFGHSMKTLNRMFDEKGYKLQFMATSFYQYYLVQTYIKDKVYLTNSHSKDEL